MKIDLTKIPFKVDLKKHLRKIDINTFESGKDTKGLVEREIIEYENYSYYVITHYSNERLKTEKTNYDELGIIYRYESFFENGEVKEYCYYRDGWLSSVYLYNSEGEQILYRSYKSKSLDEFNDTLYLRENKEVVKYTIKNNKFEDTITYMTEYWEILERLYFKNGEIVEFTPTTKIKQLLKEFKFWIDDVQENGMCDEENGTEANVNELDYIEKELVKSFDKLLKDK